LSAAASSKMAQHVSIDVALGGAPDAASMSSTRSIEDILLR
jgi:hypothetical protein